MDSDSRFTETIVYLYTYSSDNHRLFNRAELQYPGKTEIQKRPALFRNPQSFINCSMERSLRYSLRFLVKIASKGTSLNQAFCDNESIKN